MEYFRLSSITFDGRTGLYQLKDKNVNITYGVDFMMLQLFKEYMNSNGKGTPSEWYKDIGKLQRKKVKVISSRY